jgi:hypothetical protein
MSIRKRMIAGCCEQTSPADQFFYLIDRAGMLNDSLLDSNPGEFAVQPSAISSSPSE